MQSCLFCKMAANITSLSSKLRHKALTLPVHNLDNPDLLDFILNRTNLNLTTLWENSADNKLMIFLFSPENRLLHYTQIVS